MTLHLSFDDGPHPIWTPAILDLLAEYDVKATFFVVGQSIEGNEQTLQRIYDERHIIGNHSWHHWRLTEMEDDEISLDLTGVQMRVFDLLRGKPDVWRAPYFGTDERVNGIAESLGLKHVGADIVPEDCFTDSADLIAERVLHRASANFVGVTPIVSLHDGIPPDGGSEHCTQSRQPTVDAVRLILEAIA